MDTRNWKEYLDNLYSKGSEEAEAIAARNREEERTIQERITASVAEHNSRMEQEREREHLQSQVDDAKQNVYSNYSASFFTTEDTSHLKQYYTEKAREDLQKAEKNLRNFNKNR